MANDGQDLRCSVLPIPERIDTGATTGDAKDPDTEHPPIALLHPSSGAPNVLIVFLGRHGGAARDASSLGTALLDSAIRLYLWGSATTPGMAAKRVGVRLLYALAFVDATDAPFAGAKTYPLHVPPNVPVNNFWCAPVYDTQTRSMLRAEQQWPSVASDDKGLARNEDGSVDIPKVLWPYMNGKKKITPK